MRKASDRQDVTPWYDDAWAGLIAAVFLFGAVIGFLCGVAMVCSYLEAMQRDAQADYVREHFDVTR